MHLQYFNRYEAILNAIIVLDTIVAQKFLWVKRFF